MVLEIFQRSSYINHPVSLGSFTLKASSEPPPTQFKGKSGQLNEFQMTSVPYNIQWDTSENHAFGIIRLKHDKSLKILEFKRSKNTEYTLRNRGGKEYKKSSVLPKLNRGGYLFISSNKEDKKLIGKAGITDNKHILSVELLFNNLVHQKYHLFLLFPKNPRQDWIYKKIKINLSFAFTFKGKTWDKEGPEIVLKEYEFTKDKNLAIANLKQQLIEEYGNVKKSPPLHARDYLKYVDGKSEISKAFIKHLEIVVNFINSKIGSKKEYCIYKSEIACTFLSEGAILVLDKGKQKNTKSKDLKFSGYEHLGIDSYVTAWKNNQGRVRNFTPASLEKYINQKQNIEFITNEKGDRFETFKELDFLDAIYAVACLYVSSKDDFATNVQDKDVMGCWITKAKDLPIHIQYFWTTLYYNTGSSNGQATLMNQGIEYHDLIWRQEDNHAKYQGFEKYNANWRTATFRLLNAKATF